jgi:glucuronate isomerase
MQPSEGRRAPDMNSPQFAAMRKLRAFQTTLRAFIYDEKAALILSQARGTDGTVFTTNGASYADTAKAVAPELETSSEDYQRILRLAKAGQKVELEADIKTQFLTDDMQGHRRYR